MSEPPKRQRQVISAGVACLACLVLSLRAGVADGRLPAGTVLGWGQNVILGEPARYQMIAAGGPHNLAVSTGGRVLSWGGSVFGQSAMPAGLSNVISLAAGWNHSLALRADHTVVGWGLNYNGQAVAPNGLSNVVAIAAGLYQSLALRSGGAIIGWGANNYGQRDAPADLTDAKVITCGYYHSLAVRSNGTVLAFGDNTYGQTNVPSGLSNVVGSRAGMAIASHSRRMARWRLGAPTIMGN